MQSLSLFPGPGYSLALWSLLWACCPTPGLPTCFSLLLLVLPTSPPSYIYAKAGLGQDASTSPRLYWTLEPLTPATACSPILQSWLESPHASF